MRINHDSLGGGLLVATGLFVAIYSLKTYELGAVSRMGPGMLPAVLAVLLVILGCAIAFPAMKQAGETISLNLRPLSAITIATILFGILFERFGIAPAVALMAFACTFAERKVGWRAKLLLAGFLAGLAVLIFPVALGMPIRIVRWPF